MRGKGARAPLRKNIMLSSCAYYAQDYSGITQDYYGTFRFRISSDHEGARRRFKKDGTTSLELTNALLALPVSLVVGVALTASPIITTVLRMRTHSLE